MRICVTVSSPRISDHCLNLGVYAYKRSGGCRSYYSCDVGVSVPTCCKKGFRFDGQTCVQDSSCNDPCQTPEDLKRRLSQQSKDQYAQIQVFITLVFSPRMTHLHVTLFFTSFFIYSVQVLGRQGQPFRVPDLRTQWHSI